MLLLDFSMTQGNETVHYQAEGNDISLCESTRNLQAPELLLSKIRLFRIIEDIRHDVSDESEIRPEFALLSILSRIACNDSTEVHVFSICEKLQKYLDCFKKFPSAQAAGRTIPYFALDGTQILHLVLMTKKELFYKNDFDETFMYETDTGRLISNIEFADIGFLEATDSVSAGEAEALPFKKYTMEDFLSELGKTTIPVCEKPIWTPLPDSGCTNTIDKLPF